MIEPTRPGTVSMTHLQDGSPGEPPDSRYHPEWLLRQGCQLAVDDRSAVSRRSSAAALIFSPAELLVAGFSDECSAGRSLRHRH